MSETYRYRGEIITLEAVTAASNMSAGDMVALSGHTVYSLSTATIGNTGTLGYRFIGILDDDISAGASPVTVRTEGVHKLRVASGAADAGLSPGWPIYCDGSGFVTTVGAEGDAAIGTMVGISNGTWLSTGGVDLYVDVKIRPMSFNWTIAATAALSATAPLPGAFPELAAR